jgi:tRNA(fMet)-specific endonuclease VapC
VKAKLVILPYDLEAAEWYAIERARLVSLGRTPPYFDGQIAAIAVVNDLVLVTNNISDYAEFQNLQLQNWFIP